jgi:hypothetical protein
VREPEPGKPWDADMNPDAPAGFVWQCGACGKKVKNIYSEASGFDEACVLNAILSREDQ